MTNNVNIKLSSKDKIKGLKLPNNISKELAYLCGVLIGDGSLYIRKKKYDYIIKCVGNPKNEKEYYHRIIAPYFKKVFGLLPAIKLHDSNTTFGFTIHSKSLLKYFEKIGFSIGKKDENLDIPHSIKENKNLLIPFIRGLFDTDGCICFKKKYKLKPYYPVISVSSQSKKLIKEVSKILKELGFKIVETYDYKVKDKRNEKGFTIINRIELNGKDNLRKWMSTINFYSPKHLEKIKIWEENSGERI